MHYPQCNGTGDWSLTLTAKDIAGAAALYGAGSGGTGGTGGAGGGTGGTTGTPSTATASGSVAKNGVVNYQPLTVLAGTVFKVAMTGTGDADLYVNFGSTPTTSTYVCRRLPDGLGRDVHGDGARWPERGLHLGARLRGVDVQPRHQLYGP